MRSPEEFQRVEVVSREFFREGSNYLGECVANTRGKVWQLCDTPGGLSGTGTLPTKRGSRKCAKGGDQCYTRHKEFLASEIERHDPPTRSHHF